MVYLILDLDNTVWNKQALDNRTYELVSEAVFRRKISMLRHPITGAEDHDFARHSNAEIWRYKLEQILEAGEVLTKPLTQAPAPQVLVSLVSALGEYGVQYAQKNLTFEEDILLYASPQVIDDVVPYTTAIAAASSGSRKLQNHILAHFNYFSTERRTRINPFLCSFAENGNAKETLIRSCLDKYFEQRGSYPSQVVYVGDSVNDMSAIQIRRGCTTREGISYKAIGVLTGVDSDEQLRRAGADMVLPSLSDMGSIGRLKSMLRELSATEIVR